MNATDGLITKTEERRDSLNPGALIASICLRLNYGVGTSTGVDSGTEVGAMVGGTSVGGTSVGGTSVAVGGGTSVAVGGTSVAVGGTFVGGTSVAVGGGTSVGGISVATGITWVGGGKT